MVSTFIVCFALSSGIAGYVSGSYYRRYFSSFRAEANGSWQKTMLLTIVLFPSIVFSIFTILNSISVYYDTVSALPISVIFKMISIWAFVSVPLTILGTVLGRHLSGKYDPPCRINTIPRPIPDLKWFLRPVFLIFAAGILPFGSIFIEMYFIFAALWSYKFYYVYGFVLLVYFILVVVTISTTIVAVYCCLNSENYHWQWIAWGCSSSSGFYVLLYSLFYFYYKTQMSGLLQVSFYFGYM